MEQGLGSESIPSASSIDKSRVLDIKPLRCLVPIFPSQPGTSWSSTPQGSPFTCVPPTGPFPPGVAPFYPFFVSTESQRPAEQTPHPPFGAPNQAGPYGFNNPIQSPVPLNSFKTPQAPSQYSGATNGGPSRRSSRRRTSGSQQDGTNEDGYSNSQSQGEPYVNSFSMHVTDAEDTSDGVGRRKGKSERKIPV